MPIFSFYNSTTPHKKANRDLSAAEFLDQLRDTPTLRLNVEGTSADAHAELVKELIKPDSTFIQDSDPFTKKLKLTELKRLIVSSYFTRIDLEYGPENAAIIDDTIKLSQRNPNQLDIKQLIRNVAWFQPSQEFLLEIVRKSIPYLREDTINRAGDKDLSHMVFRLSNSNKRLTSDYLNSRDEIVTTANREAAIAMLQAEIDQRTTAQRTKADELRIAAEEERARERAETSARSTLLQELNRTLRQAGELSQTANQYYELQHPGKSAHTATTGELQALIAELQPAIQHRQAQALAEQLEVTRSRQAAAARAADLRREEELRTDADAIITAERNNLWKQAAALMPSGQQTIQEAKKAYRSTIRSRRLRSSFVASEVPIEKLRDFITKRSSTRTAGTHARSSRATSRRASVSSRASTRTARTTASSRPHSRRAFRARIPNLKRAISALSSRAPQNISRNIQIMIDALNSGEQVQKRSGEFWHAFFSNVRDHHNEDVLNQGDTRNLTKLLLTHLTSSPEHKNQLTNYYDWLVVEKDSGLFTRTTYSANPNCLFGILATLCAGDSELERSLTELDSRDLRDVFGLKKRALDHVKEARLAERAVGAPAPATDAATPDPGPTTRVRPSATAMPAARSPQDPAAPLDEDDAWIAEVMEGAQPLMPIASIIGAGGPGDDPDPAPVVVEEDPANVAALRNAHDAFIQSWNAYISPGSQRDMLTADEARRAHHRLIEFLQENFDSDDHQAARRQTFDRDGGATILSNFYKRYTTRLQGNGQARYFSTIQQLIAHRHAIENADLVHACIIGFLNYSLDKNKLTTAQFTDILAIHADSTNAEKTAFLTAFNEHMPGRLSLQKQSELIDALLDQSNTFMNSNDYEASRKYTNACFQYIKHSKGNLTAERFRRILTVSLDCYASFFQAATLIALGDISKDLSTDVLSEIICVIGEHYNRLQENQKGKAQQILVEFIKTHADQLSAEQYTALKNAFTENGLNISRFISLAASGIRACYSEKFIRNTDETYFVLTRYPTFSETFAQDFATLAADQLNSMEIFQLDNFAQTACYLPLEQRKATINKLIPYLQQKLGAARALLTVAPSIPEHTHKAILRIIEKSDPCDLAFIESCDDLYQDAGTTTPELKEQSKAFAMMVVKRAHSILINNGKLAENNETTQLIIKILENHLIPHITSTADLSILLNIFHTDYYHKDDHPTALLARETLLEQFIISCAPDIFTNDTHLENYALNQCIEVINREEVNAQTLVNITNAASKFNEENKLKLLTALAHRFDERDTKPITSLEKTDTDGASSSTSARDEGDTIYEHGLALSIHAQVIAELNSKNPNSDASPDAKQLEIFTRLYPVFDKTKTAALGDPLQDARTAFIDALVKHFHQLPEPLDSRRNKAVKRVMHQTICNMIREGELLLDDQLLLDINAMYNEDSPNRPEFEAAVLARPYVFVGIDTGISVSPHSIAAACKSTLKKRIDHRKTQGIQTSNTLTNEMYRCFIASMVNVRDAHELNQYLSHPVSERLLENPQSRLQILGLVPEVIANTNCTLEDFNLEDSEDDRNSLHQAMILRLMQGNEIPASLLVRTEAHMSPDNIIAHCADLYSNGGYLASGSDAGNRRIAFQTILTQNAALLITKGASFDTLFNSANRAHALQNSAESYANFTNFTLKALDVLFMQRLQFTDTNRDATDAVIQEFKQIYKQAEEGGLKGARQQLDAFIKNHRFFIADRRGDLKAKRLSAKDHSKQTQTELLAWIQLYKTHNARAQHFFKNQNGAQQLFPLAYKDSISSPATHPHLWLRLPNPSPEHFKTHLDLIVSAIARITNTIERQKAVDILIQNAYALCEAFKSELHEDSRLQYIQALKKAYQTLNVDMADVSASIYNQLDVLSRKTIETHNPDGSERKEYASEANAHRQKFKRLISFANSGLFTAADQTQFISLIQRRAAGFRLAGIELAELAEVIGLKRFDRHSLEERSLHDWDLGFGVLEQIGSFNAALDQAEAQLMFKQVVELAEDQNFPDITTDTIRRYINERHGNAYTNVLALLSAGVSFTDIANHFDPLGRETKGTTPPEIFAEKINALTSSIKGALRTLCNTERDEETGELRLINLDERFSRNGFLYLAKSINTLAETNDGEAIALRAQLRRAVYLSAAILIHRGIGFSELQEFCPSLTAAHIVAQAQDPAFAEAHLSEGNTVIDYMLNLRDEHCTTDSAHPAHNVSWIDSILTQTEVLHRTMGSSLVPDDIDAPFHADDKKRIENARLAYQRLPMEVRERVRLDYERIIVPDNPEDDHLIDLLKLIEHQARISRTHLCNTLRDGVALNERARKHHESMDELLHSDRTVNALEELRRLNAHWESLPTEDFDHFSEEKIGDEHEAAGSHVLLALGHEVEAMHRLFNPGLDEYFKPVLNIAFKNPDYEEPEDDAEEALPETVRLSPEQQSVLMSVARECTAPRNLADPNELNAFCEAIKLRLNEIKSEVTDDDEDTKAIIKRREVCKNLASIFEDRSNQQKLFKAMQRETQHYTRRFHSPEQLQNMGKQYAARASVLQARITDVERLLIEACGRNQTGRTLKEKLSYFLSHARLESNADGKLKFVQLNQAEQEWILTVIEESPAIAMTPHGLMQNLDKIHQRLQAKLNGEINNAALINLVDNLFSDKTSMMDSKTSYALVNMKRIANAFHSTLQNEMLRVSEIERDRALSRLDASDPTHGAQAEQICKDHQALYENRRKLIKDHELLMERCSTLMQREKQARTLSRDLQDLRDNVEAAYQAHQAVPAETKAHLKDMTGAFSFIETVDTQQILNEIERDEGLTEIYRENGMNAAIAALAQQKNEAIAARNGGTIHLAAAPRSKSTAILGQQQARIMSATSIHTQKAATIVERYEQRGDEMIRVMTVLTAQTFDKLNTQQATAAQQGVLENLFELALQFETNVLNGSKRPQLSFNAHAVKDKKERHALTYNLKWLSLILSFKYPNLKLNVLGCDVSLPTPAEREKFVSGLQRIGMEDQANALQSRTPKFQKALKEQSAEERDVGPSVAFRPGAAAAPAA